MNIKTKRLNIIHFPNLNFYNTKHEDNGVLVFVDGRHIFEQFVLELMSLYITDNRFALKLRILCFYFVNLPARVWIPH